MWFFGIVTAETILKTVRTVTIINITIYPILYHMWFFGIVTAETILKTVLTITK